MKYLVIKTTKAPDGSLRTPNVTVYDTKDLADQAFFTACAEASTTGLPMYAVKEVTEELGDVADRLFLKVNLGSVEPEPEEPEG